MLIRPFVTVGLILGFVPNVVVRFFCVVKFIFPCHALQ